MRDQSFSEQTGSQHGVLGNCPGPGLGWGKNKVAQDFLPSMNLWNYFGKVSDTNINTIK